ncbi:hypothetical protein FXO38_03031 [Capsicum annuum]|uniref:6-phosphogluconate dehydrogenase NADP-binding domain-containing protein n=1 Tax=Capsicum annuum TaxID=4072 RepID=A0A2G3AIJ3_CAPAN|nr:hypothetical protein FXO38_03031 [Capsicum annuum]KAF3680848.1 hypothetical protein FXO37_03135 [Capsicum annuum]PHT94008.1 hypothetical protein T459_01890 [Capsicum annuum]
MDPLLEKLLQQESRSASIQLQDGALEQLHGGKGYIDMSAVDADASSKFSEAITSKDGSFLDAPVSGSENPAEDGQLVILVAGDKALYD